jgi:hypothetical protein
MAESFMRDTVLVRRKTGTTTDPVTFEVVPVFDGVYHGRAKVQTYEGFEQRSESAGASVTVQRSQVHFPVGAFSMRVGDVVTVERSVDPLLVGRSYRVVQQAPVKSFATAYRVFVDENVGEEVPPWPPV